MNQSTPKNRSEIKVICTDTVQKTGIEKYVLEAFGHYDGLNKIWVYTERQYDFPYERLQRDLQYYVDKAPMQCINFTFVTEFDTSKNLVEVFCTSTGGHGEYKPVKLFSGRFLK